MSLFNRLDLGRATVLPIVLYCNNDYIWMQPNAGYEFIEETLDFAEWIGEARLLDRLKEKRDVLRGVRIAD